MTLFVKNYHLKNICRSIMYRYEVPLLSPVVKIFLDDCSWGLKDHMFKYGQHPMKNEFLASIFVILGPHGLSEPNCLDTLRYSLEVLLTCLQTLWSHLERLTLGWHWPWRSRSWSRDLLVSRGLLVVQLLQQLS